MNSNLTTSVENQSLNTPETKPREMTVDEYAELVAKWHQTYYTWNISCMNYYKYIRIDQKYNLYFCLNFNLVR